VAEPHARYCVNSSEPEAEPDFSLQSFFARLIEPIEDAIEVTAEASLPVDALYDGPGAFDKFVQFPFEFRQHLAVVGEPLSILIDEADQCNRHVENRLR